MQHPRVLVVDDEPRNVRMARSILAQQGIASIPAHDGKEALALALKHQPDLVLLDVLMPGIDGIEVCRQLKQNPQTAKLLVFFVTALNDGKTIERAVAAGANDFLAKPVEKAELVLRVRSMLRLHAFEKQACKHEEQLRAQTHQQQHLCVAIDDGIITPLRAVEQDLEEMELLTTSQATSTDVIKKIRANCAGVVQTAQDILMLAGLNTGQTALAYDAYAVDSLLEQVLTPLSTLLTRRNLNVVMDIVEAAPLHVDGKYLQRVLQIVISRALHRSPHNGLVQFSSKESPDSRRLELRIRDQGPDLASHNPSHYFSEVVKVPAMADGGVVAAGPDNADRGKMNFIFCQQVLAALGGSMCVTSGHVDQDVELCISLPKSDNVDLE